MRTQGTLQVENSLPDIVIDNKMDVGFEHNGVNVKVLLRQQPKQARMSGFTSVACIQLVPEFTTPLDENGILHRFEYVSDCNPLPVGRRDLQEASLCGNTYATCNCFRDNRKEVVYFFVFNDIGLTTTGTYCLQRSKKLLYTTPIMEVLNQQGIKIALRKGRD
ncbi:hypothetical protein EDD86DRAFT_245863 [Gorgonomyces haynaldii]|nr:hypothetical protein EDD86DRAFT_245863 [Gorgonomyces haynaldii]